jgi:two-component system response regulator YesN
MFVCLVSVKIASSDRWELYASSNIIEEIIGNREKCYVFTDSHNNVVLLFKDTPQHTIELLMQTCLEKLAGFLSIHGVASIGEMAASHRMLSKSYTTAVKLLNYQLVYGSDRIFSYDKYNTSFEGGKAPLLFTNFASSIEKWDKEGIRENIDRLFSDVENGNYSVEPDTFKYSIIDIMSFVLHRLSSSGLSPEFLQNTKDEIYERLQGITTQEELKSLLYDFCMNVVSHLSDHYSNNYSYYVRTVIDYVEEKYYDINISLKTMSNLIGVNAAYLGRLFKQETGEYFSDYLNEKRISEASRLLQTTYLKANEVSAKVGFSSISYFYTIFKKITGQNPGEIRR